MAAAGLITRGRDESDARLVRLWLTERARAVRGDVERERDELERRVSSCLTAPERAHLHAALVKIIAEFAELAPEPHPADDPPG